MTRAKTLGWVLRKRNDQGTHCTVSGWYCLCAEDEDKRASCEVSKQVCAGRYRPRKYEGGKHRQEENLEKSITALRQKLSAMNTEFDQADKKARELADAQRTIEEYLCQEQSRDQQKRKKRNDLE